MIVWGTKRTERVQGLVADFCPICREIRAFQLTRVGAAGHVYFISFGEGNLVAYTTKCQMCGSLYHAQPTRYSASEKDEQVNLETLIQTTFPRLREVHAQRLALEARLRQKSSSLTQDERRDLLIEPFTIVNPLVEARYASAEFDRQSGLGCLATVLIGGGLFFGSIVLKDRAKDWGLLAAAILGGVGILYTLLQLHLAPKRFVRRKIIPSLAKALAPLKPGREEIESSLERCKSVGLRIGKVVMAREIWPLLERRMAGYDM